MKFEPPSPPPSAAQEPQIPAFQARDLFGPHRQLTIEHASCVYRLQITQNNKLILTK
jgi:hemin uptake protein HemP